MPSADPDKQEVWPEKPEADGNALQFQPIDEQDRLNFAKNILCGLAFIFCLAIVVAIWYPNSGDKIFDKCVNIIPSIVTLILGYYFGKH